MDRREMEQAFMARDGSYDGLFYAAVTTTGIFCRPSCPAKKAKSEHLEYFASAKEALFAGFRPCARCRPLDGATAGAGEDTPPPWVRGLVDRVEADPCRRIPDAELAAEGIDASAARRWFLRNYGMTFQAYCRARRLGAAFQSIKEGAEL